MDQEPRALIKRHNEYVREQVVRDLEALEEKMNVKRQVSHKAHDVVDKAKGTLGMKSQEEVHGVGGFAKANAVPLAAVGLGGALLARNATKMKSSSNGHVAYTETTVPSSYEDSSSPGMKDKLAGKVGGVKDTATSKVSDVTGTVTGKASDVKGTVAGKASDVRGTVTDKATGVKDTVADTGTMVAVRASEMKDSVVEAVPSRQQVTRVAKDNAPLLGLAALAAGILAGALAPRTRMEEERIAPLQESLAERAHDVVEQGKDMVGEKVDTAKSALKTGVETVQEELSTSDSDTGSEPMTTTPNRITASSGVNGYSNTPAGSL